MKRTSGNTGNRYSDEEKNKILAFIEKQGRGGLTAAQEKFGVSYIAIRSWKDKGYGTPTKPVKMKEVLAKVPKLGRPKGTTGTGKRGRPMGSKNKIQSQPKLTNRPGRPASNSKAVKLVANIRASMAKMGNKVASLESMLA